ncbi:hypothetical protein BaRGS_00002900 [Batillaria attramentaria]|uniref:C2H2-type domain-containing protein n=1 Tax=Batillaria attramentaria TaxID=370345 RepID=A0ABD0M2U2_9CAEN
MSCLLSNRLVDQVTAEERPDFCGVCWRSLHSTDNDQKFTKTKLAGICFTQSCRADFAYASGFVHGFLFCQVLCRLVKRLASDKEGPLCSPHVQRAAELFPASSTPEEKIQIKTSPVVCGYESACSLASDSDAKPLTTLPDACDDELAITFGSQTKNVCADSVKSKQKTVCTKTKRKICKTLSSTGSNTVLASPQDSVCADPFHDPPQTALISETSGVDFPSVLVSDTVEAKFHHPTETKDSGFKPKPRKLKPKAQGKRRHLETVCALGDKTMNVTAETEKCSENKKKKRRLRDEPLACEICFKVVQGKSNLNQHIKRMHSEEEPVECDICGRVCRGSVSLEDHKKRAHMASKMVCYICGAQMQTFSGLKVHLATHDGVKRHFCDVCGAGFVRHSSLRYHRKLHTEVRAFLCELCSFSFKTAEALNGHLLYKHRSGPYFDNRVRGLEKMGIKIDKEAVRRHTNQQCVECGENLESETGKCPTHPEASQEVFQCTECGQAKKDIVEFHLHMRHHRGEKIPRRASKKGISLQRVQPVKRDSAREFQCNVCSLTFSTKSKMYNHKRQHEDKSYTCHICGYKTRFKSNLNTHISTHTDVRPFQCEICQKTFKLKSALRNHSNLHGGDAAQFKCDICGKGLTRKRHLAYHYKVMHPEADANTN